jgi:hypothetical protein
LNAVPLSAADSVADSEAATCAAESAAGSEVAMAFTVADLAVADRTAAGTDTGNLRP